MQPADLDVAHRFTQVNGLRAHYVERGEGPIVLLLHGFPESWWSWRHQIGALASAGYRVIAPDQRGYGETDRKGPYDLDTLASDARALLAAVGGDGNGDDRRADVIGHGWGGAVAWHLAATRPECVRRLAVLGCPHPAQMAAALRRSARQVGRSWHLFLFQLPWLPEQALARFGRSVYRKRARLSEGEIAPFLEGLRRPGAAQAMLGWHRAAFRAALRNWWRVPRYPAIEAETLLVWGGDDFDLGYQDLVPGTERYAPRLQVEVVAGGGHFLHADQPERANELLLGFLGSVPKPEGVYQVVLAAVGENKIGVIREIRDITGLELMAVKELVDSAPQTIVEGASRKEAEQIRQKLTEAGAIVEIGP